MADGGDRAFLAEARAEVLAYLERHGIKHGGVPAEPAWFVAPYVAVWPIQSGRFPRSTGWFAIVGDLPTDYVSSADAPNARSVLRHFSRAWREIADYMARGVEHPECRIGRPETWPELHDLLRRRAEVLGEFAADDRVWGEPG